MSDPRTAVRAAGAVVWRRAGSSIEVALVHRPRYQDWSLPKGKALPNEHSLITAVREVGEETGEHVALGRRLIRSTYTSDGKPKLVDYWAATPVAGNGHAPAAIPGAAAGHSGMPEVDKVAWLGLADARARLTYQRDVEVLDAFAEAPAGTVPLIFLRHASAAGRRAWRDAGNADDTSRPLSELGQAQAAELARVLMCFPPAQVISSSARRCLQTVGPYAARAGVGMVAEAAFGLNDGTGGGSEWMATAAAERRITETVTSAEPVIICAHRQNLPLLLAMACERLGAAFPAGPSLRTGSFWVLHVASGSVVAAERHDTDGTKAARDPR